MERPRVVVPEPGDPLMVILNYIPPIFRAFLIIWDIASEQTIYQRIHNGKKPR
jgi:hypothetical protein